MTAGLAPSGAVALGVAGGAAFAGARQWVRSVVRFASESFVTGPLDIPPNEPIVGRLLPFRVRREIGTDRAGRFAGVGGANTGEIQLSNLDGALDRLLSTISQGGDVRVRVGKVIPDGAREVVQPLRVFSDLVRGTARQWAASDQAIVLGVDTKLARLDVPVQPGVYGGSGADDGDIEISGMPLPICYGQCRNVTPILVDRRNLIYQVHDRQILAIDAVYDSMIPLSLDSDVETYQDLAETDEGERPPGSFQTCLARGMFRLASQPVGRVTADVRGGDRVSSRSIFSDGTTWTDGTGFASNAQLEYTDTTAGIISRLLVDRGILRLGEVETTSFGTLAALVPDPVGIYIAGGERPTLREAVERLCAGAGLYLQEDVSGRLALGRVSRPRSASRELDATQIVSMRSLELPYGVPPTSWAVSYGKNWTPMNSSEVAAGASEALRTFATRESEVVAAGDPEVSRAVRQRRTVTIEGLWATREGAAAAAAHAAETYGLGRLLSDVRLPLFGARIPLGSRVRITFPHPGYRSGRDCVVVGQSFNLEARETVMQVFG